MNHLIKTKLSDFNHFKSQPTRLNVELNLDFANKNKMIIVNNGKKSHELMTVLVNLQRYKKYKLSACFNIMFGKFVFFLK